jgi:hypothetical protein
MTAVVEALWPAMRVNGPRWGVDVEVVSFRLLAVAPEEMSEDCTGGPSDLWELHSPTEPSVDADKILEDGLCTARESILPL